MRTYRNRRDTLVKRTSILVRAGNAFLGLKGVKAI